MNNSKAVMVDLAKTERADLLAKTSAFSIMMRKNITINEAKIAADCIKMQASAAEHMSASTRISEAIQRSHPDSTKP